jgi:hypothetical protein
MKDSAIGEGAVRKVQTCPFLGLKEDPETAWSYPSAQNCCFHAKPAMAVKMEHQGAFCLTRDHTNCEVYKKKPGSALPVNLRYKPDKSRQSKKSGIISLVAVFLVAIFVLFFVLQNSSRWPVSIVFKGSPSGSAISAISTNTKMQVSLTPSIQAQTTPTSTRIALTPTQIHSNETFIPIVKPGHALETPIGMTSKLIIHRVKANESLVSIANHFATNVEAIKAINYYIKLPLSADKLIVIPYQQADVRGLPAFEPYLVKTSLPVETLARQLSVSPTLFKNFNGFENAERLSVGDWVLIPHMSTAAP